MMLEKVMWACEMLRWTTGLLNQGRKGWRLSLETVEFRRFRWHICIWPKLSPTRYVQEHSTPIPPRWSYPLISSRMWVSTLLDCSNWRGCCKIHASVECWGELVGFWANEDTLEIMFLETVGLWCLRWHLCMWPKPSPPRYRSTHIQYCAYKMKNADECTSVTFLG